MIASPYKITFTPEGGSERVLVYPTDWLARLPEFSGEQEIYEEDGVTLIHAFFRPLGGAVWSFVIEVADPSNLAVALAAHIDGGGAAELLDIEGELVFQPEDEDADPTVFNPAVIRQMVPELPSDDETFQVTQYHFLASIPTI